MIFAHLSLSRWLKRRAELRLGVRITAAGVIGYALAYSLNLPQGYWTVFTAVLVVQGSVGGSLKAAVDRLIGTLSGAVYGAVIATFVPHFDALTIGFALLVSLAPLAVLAAMSPSFRVAPITAVILLLGSAGATEGPFIAATFRIAEVSLGGIVGLAISLFVVPARGHAVMGEQAKRLTQLMAQLFQMLLEGLSRQLEAPAVSAQHDRIQAAFDKLEAAAAEAKLERRNLLLSDVDPDPIPRTLRRLYHDFVLIGRVAAKPLSEPARSELKEPLDRLSAATMSFLTACGNALSRREPAPSLEACETALARAIKDIEKVKDGDRLVALSFAFEQMELNLSDLARRTQEFGR
ncbi:MAG TPA: FUSC family protein [Micropepsaceae bacterium]|nr:FUSC family protein [Micropepsaceae bacterium]